ncbi:hypothetical protein HOY80DRAFT_458477 [Tuber brumale]|nr:hypothetical protein HOY80DRAFT_458477 [Tuber brumale]
MAQIPNPMPPEEDRHIIIVPFSQQPEPRVEPPSRDSRSPTPELPANFVPKPPLDSSQFPAASTILSLMERMAGGSNIRDLIMVPAATWDHNNVQWEFKQAQLRKQHRKDWAKREVELRRKYDEEFSDARYRQMLVEKEMKELDFIKTTSNQTIFGKTWDEHKAEKQRVEEGSQAVIEAAQRRAGEYETLIEDLKKQVDEKEAVIKALQSAIAGRADNRPTQQQFGNPMEVSMPSQQFMYLQAPVQGPSTALVVRTPNPTPLAQAHMQPPPRIVEVPPGTPRGPSNSRQHVTSSTRYPRPPATRDRDGSQDVRGPDRRTAFRNDTPRGYDNPRNQSGGVTRAPDKHHNVGDGSRDSRSTVGIQPKREYQSDRENRDSTRGGVQVLNPSREWRAERETSQKALRAGVSMHTREQSGDFPADIATQGQLAGSWRPPRRLAPNEIQTIQSIGPEIAYPTPSQPAVWAKKFVTPPGGNVQTRSDPKQGSLTAQSSSGRGEVSRLAGMPKSVSARSTSARPPIPAESSGPLVKAKPETPFFESSQSGKGTKEAAQFRVSRNRESASMKEKTVGDHKLRRRASTSSPDSRNTAKRRKRGRGMASELGQAASRSEKLVSAGNDDIPGSLVDYDSISDSDTDSSEGYTNPRIQRPGSPLFLPKVKSPRSHKKVSSLAKPTSIMHSIYDFEAGSDDLFREGTGGYIVFSDFNSRMPRRIEPKTEPEAPVEEATTVKQPRNILEIYDDAKKKSIMVYNSRKFKRVLTISVIPGRYSKDPPGPEYLLNKVRGGPLEYVKSFPETNSITFAFIHPTDAQVFWEFFNNNPDAKECDRRFNVEVNWAQDAIEPLSKILIGDLIDGSASRMIKVYQCPSDKSNVELKAAFCANGPKDGYNEVISVKGKKEKTRRKHNGGLGIVAYVECASIIYASTLMEAIRNNEYEGFNGAEVVYGDDPCAFKDGAPNKVDSLRSW